MSRSMIRSSILVSALAFPVAAMAAEVSFIPVRASGPHQILAPNGIYLPHGGQRVTFDFFVAKWDPDFDGDPLLKVVQVLTQLGSYANASSPTPLDFPEILCTADAQCDVALNANDAVCRSHHTPACSTGTNCCEAFYIDTTRPDWWMAGRIGYWAFQTLDGRMGGAVDPGEEVADDGTRKYIGSLVLDVPGDAIGEFTLTLNRQLTFLESSAAPGSSAIPIDVWTPAKVFVGVPPTTEYGLKPRYFTVPTETSGGEIAYGVKLVSLHRPDRPAPGSPYQPADFSAFEGQVRWLGPIGQYTMSPSLPQHLFPASQLQCTEYFSDEWGGQFVAVFGAEVLPDSTYEVKAFTSNCTDFDTCGWNLQTFRTGRWGDVIPPFEDELAGSQPDLADIGAMVDRFRTVFGCGSKAQTQLYGNTPDPMRKVDFADITLAIDAFRGYAYPFAGPTACP